MVKPVMALNIVVLPAPFGPMRPKTSPVTNLQRHRVDGDEPAERHCERVRGQQRVVGSALLLR